MKTVLILGINSFVGSHLAKFIKANHPNINLVGTSRSGGKFITPVFFCEIEKQQDIFKIIKSTNPDIIFNCIGISSFEDCEKDLVKTLNINSFAIANILDAINIINPKIKFINLGSISELDTNESNYSLSKKISRSIINRYQNKNIWATQIYLSQITGIDQNSIKFITPKIINAAREIKNGKLKKLEIGNLDSEINPLYIDEAVELIWSARNYDLVDLFIEGGQSIKIKNLIELIFKKFNILDWDKYVIVNKNLIRPKNDINIPNQIVRIKSKLNVDVIIEKILNDRI